jgi:hypothetical protein
MRDEACTSEPRQPEHEYTCPVIHQVIDCPRCHRRGVMDVPEGQDNAEYACTCGYSVEARSWSARDAVRKVVAEVRDQARKNRMSS